jgi:protein tyrosine phosphatase (PTP) superfamily phosphohydrolase (DUF442 family)
MLVGSIGFLIGLQALGNGGILASSVLAQIVVPSTPAPRIEGISNFRVVDDHLWRGAQPTEEGYRALADHGVTTIIDLRGESNSAPAALLRELDMHLVRVPIRDGQLPNSTQIERIIDVIDSSEGRVFIHCAAGVGRTGAIVAAYNMSAGVNGRWSALLLNLEVGPPSLEQIAFIAGAEDGEPESPSVPLVVLSRFLDGPRLLWNELT